MAETNALLYDERTAAADLAIKRLGHRRQAIADGLEAFRVALEAVVGKPPHLEMLQTFFQLPDLEAVEDAALQIWVEKQQTSLPIKREMLRAALETPNEVADLVNAYQKIIPSMEPARYWLKKAEKFEALPVTNEEAAEIRRREKKYIQTPDDGRAYEFLRALAAISTRANASLEANIFPSRLAEVIPWAAPFLKHTEIRSRLGRTTYGYSARAEFFLRSETKYLAFDEEK